jgi:hypothetical protein
MECRSNWKMNYEWVHGVLDVGSNDTSLFGVHADLDRIIDHTLHANKYLHSLKKKK